jgi:hypothetical protein
MAVATSIGASLPGGAAQAATTTSSTTTSSTAVKAPVSGLMDRHHPPKAAYAGVVRGHVVNTTWAAVQPVKGGPIVHPNPIDQAIAVAKKNGYALKLRVRAGIDAPAWAKKLGGAPMTFYYTGATANKTGTVAGTVGRFWTPQFGAAYDELQRKLAAEYDGVPEIRQTDITRCTTIFAEPYLRDAMDKRNVRALLGAGFTTAKDQVCHAQQVVAHDVWQRTISDLAFNPYNSIRPDAKVRTDLAYTLSQMGYCRSVLGPRCSLSNHSLASKRLTSGAYGEMYAHMRKLGGPIDLQTATAAKIGDYQEVLAFASGMGASSVELPTGYERWSMTHLETAARSFTG